MIAQIGCLAIASFAVDEPWNEMDYGPFLSAVVEVTPENIAPKGIAIPLDEDGEHAMLFDSGELRWVAAWTGDFVELKGIVYDGPHGVWPRISGEPVFTTMAGPGIARGSRPVFKDPRIVPYGPLPMELGRWRGLVRNENGMLLHYSIGDSRVYERPGIVEEDELLAWTRSLEFHDVTEPIHVRVLELEDGVTLAAEDVRDLPNGGAPEQGTEYLFRKNNEPVLLVHAKGVDTALNPRRLGLVGSRVGVEDGHLLVSALPPMPDALESDVPSEIGLPRGSGHIRLLIAPVTEETLPAYRAFACKENGTAPKLLAQDWTAGGESLWPEQLTLEGELEFNSGETEGRQRMSHAPESDPVQVVRTLRPGQTAQIVRQTSLEPVGNTGWLDDSVVLIKSNIEEAPQGYEWDVVDGVVKAKGGTPELVLQDVKIEKDALQFNGKSHATVPDHGLADFLDAPFTVATWIQTDQDGTVFSFTQPSGPWVPDGKTLFIRDGRLCYDVGWVGVVCGEERVNDGSWHHVALTWNPDEGFVNIWVDGRLDASGELVPNNPIFGAVVRFGFTASNFPGRSWFSGSMRGMRIFEQELSRSEIAALASTSDDPLIEVLAIRGVNGAVQVDGETITVELDPVESEVTGEVLEWFGRLGDLPDFWSELDHYQPNQSAPFIIDRVSWPSENPWDSWMRFGDFDFLDDGKAAAISTWNGDVWRVDGIDQDLDALVWQRIASGLSQPLGLKTRGDEILVIGRDQVTRLVDSNGDRETDRYEAFNVDTMNAPHFHEPTSGLQVDAAGNLYYMKGARHALLASHPQHGTTIKMSPDGEKSEIVASGFRAPNGLWVDADGVIFGTDQEGHWTPANRINRVVPGGFYGYNWSGTELGKEPRAEYDPPLCWLHPTVDRSPAGLVRVPQDTWGDLAGRLLGISYGTGRVYMVLEDEVDGIHQGGIVPLPIEMPTGTMRGRFNDSDGDLYVSGLFGWSSDKTDPGGFYRVRRSESVFPMPQGVRAVKDGLIIFFNDPIATPDDMLTDAFNVEAWNYEWTRNYGSLQYDIKTGQAGTTMLPIEEVQISGDRRMVWLHIPEMQPAMQMHVEWALEFENSAPRESFIHLSVHRLAEMSGQFMLD